MQSLLISSNAIRRSCTSKRISLRVKDKSSRIFKQSTYRNRSMTNLRMRREHVKKKKSRKREKKICTTKYYRTNNCNNSNSYSNNNSNSSCNSNNNSNSSSNNSNNNNRIKGVTIIYKLLSLLFRVLVLQMQILMEFL